ncbi:MAG: hypothetical protein ACREO9_07270, partial [Lysobacterales bacterium]
MNDQSGKSKINRSETEMMRNPNIARKITLVLALSTAFVPVLAQAARVDVELEVSGTALVVTGNSKQCDGGPIDCIEVGNGKQPNIYFYLDNACGSGPGAPPYKLTGVFLSMVKGMPVGDDNPLPKAVIDDFGADTSGKVTLLDPSPSGSKLKIKNKN